MEYLISAMRYVSPVAAVVILLVCIVSLFRNRPRIHTLAKLIDQNDGSEIEINHWETSIGKSKANDVVLPLLSKTAILSQSATFRLNLSVTMRFRKRAELNFAHRCRRHRIQLHTACLLMSKQSAPFI